MRIRFGAVISLVILALIGFLIIQCGGQNHRDLTSGELEPEVLSSFYAADSAFQQKNYRMALTHLKQAVATDSMVPEMYFLQGKILLELNQFDKARSAFQKVRTLDPEFQGVWFQLGHTAFQQDDYEEALRKYAQERRAIETHRIGYSPDAYAAVLIQIGRCYTRLGQIENALQIYQKARLVDSSSAVIYADLGQLYKNEGEFAKGLEYYHRALQLASENLEYRYFYGYLLLQTGQPNAAVEQLRIVAEQQPWDYGAQYNLGLALSRIGESAEGQRRLEIADTLQDLDYDIQTAQRTVRTFPNNTYRWIRLGDLLRKAGRYEEAIQAYQVACFLAPGNMPIRNKLANCYVHSGESAKAILLYREVLRQDSTLVNVWVNLGVAYMQMGQRLAARQAWESALHLDPNHQQARRYLSE